MRLQKIIIGLLTLLCLTWAVSASAQSLVPTVEYPDQTNNKGSKISLVNQLPASNWRVIVADIIKMILAVTGSLAVVSFTVGGVMMVTARGSEDVISKAKSILYMSILALVIIAVSYGVVVGITQLEFFQ